MSEDRRSSAWAANPGMMLKFTYNAPVHTRPTFYFIFINYFFILSLLETLKGMAPTTSKEPISVTVPLPIYSVEHISHRPRLSDPLPSGYWEQRSLFRRSQHVSDVSDGLAIAAITIGAVAILSGIVLFIIRRWRKSTTKDSEAPVSEKNMVEPRDIPPLPWKSHQCGDFEKSYLTNMNSSHLSVSDHETLCEDRLSGSVEGGGRSSESLEIFSYDEHDGRHVQSSPEHIVTAAITEKIEADSAISIPPQSMVPTSRTVQWDPFARISMDSGPRPSVLFDSHPAASFSPVPLTPVVRVHSRNLSGPTIPIHT
ncbi:hypothetical protein C8Q75DRAFT_777923 [Abortiporus biennis]|nr:hypothetical protein C8Q75DRAFT_777923 [Abortiporus biennis]